MGRTARGHHGARSGQEPSAKAYRSTLAAAERHGSLADEKARVRQRVAAEGASERFVTQVLGRELAL